MTITKERLEELAKENAKIYYIPFKDISIERTAKSVYERFFIKKDFAPYNIYEKNYYETKEEAEFVQKFHTKKTIYFEPPTWEEFLKTETDIRRPNYTCENVMIIDYDNEILVEDYNNDLNEKHFNYDKGLNNRKEKYYEAVEYAKKLFLGEER